MDARELDRCVEIAAGAHQRLLAALDDALDRGDLEPGRPSLLPEWTVGHVLTHIARNADSHSRMFDGAARGEVLDQYEGGAAGRNADIEAGARRSLAELVDDVRRSAWRLEQHWAVAEHWERIGRTTRGGDVPMAELPFLRAREVEVHHADLGVGYTFATMPAEYVRRELSRMEMLWKARQPMGLTGLPPAVLAVDEPTRLAWLMGRTELAGLDAASIF